MDISYQKYMNNNLKIFDMQIIKEKGCFYITCFSKNKEEMGIVSFKINENFLWVYKLKTNQNFYRQGVASAILDIVEYIAIKNGVNIIEGKFFPDNNYALPFYEKNGFHVPNQTKTWDDYDPYWRLYKILDIKTVKEKVANNIIVKKEKSQCPNI